MQIETTPFGDQDIKPVSSWRKSILQSEVSARDYRPPTFRLGDYAVSLPAPSCAGNPPFPLSQREKQVLFLSACGRTGPEIAYDINVSANTVATYKRRILEKLGCRSISEAVALAAAYVMGAKVELSDAAGHA